jgi:hypothetical protein
MELQVWRRNPAGQEQQVTAFGSSSEVRSLGENGELVLMHAEGASRQLYLDLPGQGGPAPVASDQGTAFVRGGITYIAVGRTLFRVTP